jgi:hypothetical protein
MNRSTYQVKPFYLSSETVLPFTCNVYRYIKVEPTRASSSNIITWGLYKLHPAHT